MLGLSSQKWTRKLQESVKNLHHHDLEVLGIEVVETTRGEIIEFSLDQLANTVGKPVQIIADHGSDLKKGIELYISKNPEIIYTYDFTHQIALWLKKELSNNPKFQEFCQRCNLTRSQIQQTNLSFLRPPSQRSKARYHNIDILVTWALNVLQYWKKQDFSRITTQLIIDRETLLLLKEELDQASLDKLAKMLGTKAENFTSFSQAIADQLGRELVQEKGRIISQAADLGRRKFLEKLGWLFSYEQELTITAEILEVFALAKNQLIQQGLHQKSQQEWENLAIQFEPSPWVQKAQQKVSEYLAIEGQKIPTERVFIATSDIIESLFGKYKIFSSSSPCSEIAVRGEGDFNRKKITIGSKTTN